MTPILIFLDDFARNRRQSASILADPPQLDLVTIAIY